MDITVYLDLDGVLVTKFSDELQFDKVCVDVLRDLLGLCQNHFETVRLCVISNWRFEKTEKELTELLVAHRLLEDVDILDIPTQFPNREQQIIKWQQGSHFIILDDANYTHPKLKTHLVQLRAEDGLRAIDDVTYILQFANKN